MVSKSRARFRAEAEKAQRQKCIDAELDDQEVDKAVRKINNRNATKKAWPDHEVYNAYKEPTAPGRRYKGKRRARLNLTDKIEITHRVLVEHELQASVAKRYRINLNQVCSLVMKA